MDKQDPLSPIVESVGTTPSGTTRSRSKKNVNIVTKVKSEDYWNDYPTYLNSDFRNLKTCVPIHIERDGLIVNDLREDHLLVSSSDSFLSLASARAPSDDLLNVSDSKKWADTPGIRETASTGTSVPKFPFQVEHALTLEEIKSGLQRIGSTANGYNVHFRHLDISNKGLLDISLVEQFSELTSIDMSANYIQDVKLLGGMPYLRVVNASKNEVQVFGDFLPPVALQQVNFSRNNIYKIINLDNLWALTEVNLSHNYLENVDGFDKCENLKVLDLSHNKISSIRNFDCPNLIALFLHNNRIKTIMDLRKCTNLRSLSLAQNQIEILEPLSYLPALQELWLQSNKISDLHELRHFKSLLNLVSVFVEPNPFNGVGLWKRMVIFIIPQLRFLDGHPVTPENLLEANNTFNPSYLKISHENRMAVLLDRTCQSATTLLDDNVHSTATLPPVLLLVGAPMSRSSKLSTLLKDRFKADIQLGGVHSTATTLEFPNTNKDIPVSFEGFLSMKSRGEFLAYSHILGRACGFATSHITRASERNMLLVASVPLGIALELRKWNIQAKVILVMPSSRINVHQLKKKGAAAMESSQRDDSFDKDDNWMKMVKRHSKQTINFNKEKTFHDLEYHGDKRPSMDATPYGPAILKNKEDENQDDLPPRLKSNVSFKFDPSLHIDSAASNREQSDITDLANTSFSGPNTQSLNSVPISMGSTSTTDSQQNEERHIEALPIVPQISTTEAKLSEEIKTPCTEQNIPQFLSDPKAYPEVSTVHILHRLRRIASMFLEVGFRANVFEELSSLPREIADSLDWKQALLELQLQEVPRTTQTYNMLINRLSSPNRGIKSQHFFETCLKQTSSSKLQAKAGDLELVFLKDTPETNILTLPKTFSKLTCTDVEGRIKVEKHSVISNGNKDQPENANTTTINQSFDQKPSLKYIQTPERSHVSHHTSHETSQGIFSGDKQNRFQMEHKQSNFGPISTPLVTPGVCRAVVNPNYAFGPHNVCAGKFPYKCPHIVCCPVDLERGTFYKGNFRSDFLDSGSTPITNRAMINTPVPAWCGEDDEDVEGLFCMSGQSMGKNLTECVTTLPPQFTSNREFSGELDEIPWNWNPSRSCSITGTNDSKSNTEKEDDIPSETESEVTLKSSRQHTHIRHRENLESCIMNEREKYIRFHQENPGFFTEVVDSDDIDKSVETLCRVVEDMIRLNSRRIPTTSVSYANTNAVDARVFLNQRKKEYQTLADGFLKGQPAEAVGIQLHNKQINGLRKFSNKDFEPSKCPPDLLDPFIARKTRMTKIRKIIQSTG